jgi:MoaA/NifB/PqqE/SkfB family radical SAM enzyme
MIVSGWERRAVQARVLADVGRLALRRYRDPVRAAGAVRSLARLRSTVREGRPTPRIARVGGRWFSHLHAPGWPSATFEKFIDNEFARMDDARGGNGNGLAPHPPRLQCVIVAVTRQCPLRCEHCCEWDVLNQDDALSMDAQAEIVERFQALGVTQIQFSGGEPLTRADDIARVVAGARPGTDFWILTAGVGLTAARARQLRAAGLTGVCVSLDHWDADEHNRFRGFGRAFEWVGRAAASAREAGLVLSVTLCPTRGFVSDANLARYLATASRLGADFIQILEPRPIGHFAGQDVALRPDEQAVLERFFVEVNFSRAHRRMPIVVYPGLANRRVGCVGAGTRYAYVDTDGEMHPCPFCRRPSGSVLGRDFQRDLVALGASGCPAG